MEMPQCEEITCQNEMEEDWNGSPEPPPLRMERHSNDVPQNHGGEVQITEPPEETTHGPSRNHKEAVSPQEVSGYLAQQNENQNLDGKKKGIRN
jgi:hypothetical protein